MKKVLFLLLFFSLSNITIGQETRIIFRGDTALRQTIHEEALAVAKNDDWRVASLVCESHELPVFDSLEFKRPMKFPYGIIFNEKGKNYRVSTLNYSGTGLPTIVSLTNSITKKDFIMDYIMIIMIVVVIVSAFFYARVGSNEYFYFTLLFYSLSLAAISMCDLSNVFISAGKYIFERSITLFMIAAIVFFLTRRKIVKKIKTQPPA